MNFFDKEENRELMSENRVIIDKIKIGRAHV